MTLDDVFDDVLEIISRLGARISGDTEPFISEQITQIPGTMLEVIHTVSEIAPSWFRSVAEPPRWIQDAEWPMRDGKPMIFLGQIDIPSSSELFHDDAAAYVFVSPASGITESVIQVA